MEKNELKKEVAKINWFHKIDLGDGIVTPGLDDSKKKLKLIKLDEDLSGKTVLDIGAWNGFFSFEAEKRRASRVLAIDSFMWGGQGWGSKDGFNLARDALNSKVEDKEIDVLGISPETVGVFDLVFFIGVLYHMRHPLLALEKIASVTKEKLILETEVEMMDNKRPVTVFYPSSELDGDGSNWWVPNPAAVEAMLKTAGFQKIQRISTWAERKTDGIKRARMVFHAWK